MFLGPAFQELYPGGWGLVMGYRGRRFEGTGEQYATFLFISRFMDWSYGKWVTLLGLSYQRPCIQLVAAKLMPCPRFKPCDVIHLDRVCNLFNLNNLSDAVNAAADARTVG